LKRSKTSESIQNSKTEVNDINARAAQVAAGNNIMLQAGQATSNMDQMASAKGQDLFFTSTIQTRRQVNSVQGQSVNITAT
jgi:hypothetical protein